MAPTPHSRPPPTLANASERRSIAFEYQQTPIYYKPVHHRSPPSTKRAASRWNCRLLKRKWFRSTSTIRSSSS